MLNILWLGMIALSVITALFMGRINEIVRAITDSAKLGFDIALGLTAIMALWLGIMAVASEVGLVKQLGRLLKPIMRPLFPDVPVDHPAMGAIILNIAANMLGLANAATPFGLKAMKELATLNENPTEASDAMCTFLAINTSSVQLIPVTAIAFLAANGNTEPGSIVFTSLIATTCSTLVAIVAVKQLAKFSNYRLKSSKEVSSL